MRRDVAVAMAGVALATAALAPAAAAAIAIGATRRARRAAELGAALARLGVRERPRRIEALGGGRSNAVWRVHLRDRAIVVKRALPMGAVLALGARWVGPQPFHPDVGAAARIRREARALRALAAAGVCVPAVLAAEPERGVLIMADVAGAPLPVALAGPRRTAWILAFAASLRAAHAAGVALTDGHPGNARALPGGAIALLDLEFAELADDLGAGFAPRRAFDVAYAAAFFAPADRAAFIDAAGDPPGVAAAAARLAAFEPLLARERARQQRVHR
jgi:hypothetical protein